MGEVRLARKASRSLRSSSLSPRGEFARPDRHGAAAAIVEFQHFPDRRKDAERRGVRQGLADVLAGPFAGGDLADVTLAGNAP